MDAAFKLDGVAYKGVFVPEDGIKRGFSITDGKNAGRTLSGNMIRDIVGTYYNYSIELDTTDVSRTDYDAMYEVLSSPENYHVMEVPYGQETLSYKAYVTSGEDILRCIRTEGNDWHGLSINFIAMEPARRPGGG